MNKQALRSDILLLLTACIWGFAFAAQRKGMEYVGPFTYNGVRFCLGSLSLLPLIALLRRRNAKNRRNSEKGRGKTLFRASFLAGSCLFLAATLQQIGILSTTAGNSGFITGLYVVFTPIIGIFLGKKTGIPTWIGACLTLGGLFFVSLAENLFKTGSLVLNPGDAITAVSALFWAFHVLIIDALVKRTDPVALSSGQFAFCGIFSLIAAIILKEDLSLQALKSGIIPILYGGLCSVGIAYTLQVVAQKHAPPAHATILLSLEGVFAALGGYYFLDEFVGIWSLAGFLLMFCGMLATQWEVIAGKGLGKTP